MKPVDIVVCLGGICFMKGSMDILSRFRYLIDKEQLDDMIDLNGRFCMGKCFHGEGVCLKINDMFYNVKKEDSTTFFYETVLSYLPKQN